MGNLTKEDERMWREFTKYIKKHEPCNVITSDLTLLKQKQVLPTHKILSIPEVGTVEPNPNQQVQLLSINDIKNFTIQSTLDLHGYTVDEAWKAFDTFIKKSYHLKLRMVLVITGKGKHGNHPGILQSMILKWIPTYPQYVIGYLHALPKHGGSGALCIRLRKNLIPGLAKDIL